MISIITLTQYILITFHKNNAYNLSYGKSHINIASSTFCWVLLFVSSLNKCIQNKLTC